MPKPKKELATKQFRVRISPEQKKQLEFIAEHEGRSMGNLIKRIIAEKYNQIKGETNDHSN